MSTYFSRSASNPVPTSDSFTLLIITEPSSPAFAAIWYKGDSNAFNTIFAPVFSSPSKVSANFSTSLDAWIYAEPPPAIMPSSAAALVAFRASSIRSFASFISVSVAAPTRITATPPASFARRSCNFSLSKSEVVSSICFLIWAILAWIASLFPSPSTITVFSFWTFTDFARPNWSIVVSFKSKPSSSLITWPPVRIAMSSSIAFLLSPYPGAFTATTLNVPRSLFTINVVRASPSTSSATIRSFAPDCTTCSNSGRISWILEIFLSVIRI